MRPGDRARRRDRGFTYVGLLALIAVLGLLLGAASAVASTAARRGREAQLLWVGHAYRAAIGRYWLQHRAYPRALRDLLGTARDAPIQVRYLRSLYPDPMTGALDWVAVPAPDGGVMGIASRSGRAPLKTANFDPADRAFERAATYGDWQFTFAPGPLRRRPP